jgi:hypothetical protein
LHLLFWRRARQIARDRIDLNACCGERPQIGVTERVRRKRGDPSGERRILRGMCADGVELLRCQAVALQDLRDLRGRLNLLLRRSRGEIRLQRLNLASRLDISAQLRIRHRGRIDRLRLR